MNVVWEKRMNKFAGDSEKGKMEIMNRMDLDDEGDSI